VSRHHNEILTMNWFLGVACSLATPTRQQQKTDLFENFRN